jgi:hypothetical protein
VFSRVLSCSLVFSRVSRVSRVFRVLSCSLVFYCSHELVLFSILPPPLARSTGKPTNGGINYFGTNLPKRKNIHTQAYYDKKAALKRKRSEQQSDNGAINHISLQRTNRLYTTGGGGRLPSERRVGGSGYGGRGGFGGFGGFGGVGGVGGVGGGVGGGGGGGGGTREKQRALEAAKKQRALDAELKELARVAQVRIYVDFFLLSNVNRSIHRG